MDEMTLEHARKLLRLNQRDLERAAGVCRGTVHEIENGRNKRPSYDTVVRIVSALQRHGLPGITAEQLFPVPELPATPAPDEQSQVA